MAHFAQLDDKNIVTNVIVVSNDDTSDNQALETESIGDAFCQKSLGASTTWKQTSYNARGTGFRGNYAGIGHTYMTGIRTLGVASTDIFISQQPFPSWSIGINTAGWYPPEPPGERPYVGIDSTGWYEWSESNYNTDPTTAWVFKTD